MSELLPATFTDALGREWRLKFNGAIKDDAKELYGADLADVEKGSFFVKLATDDRAFFGVLWLLIERQVEALGLSEREVKEGFDAEAVERASDAINEAVLNFTRPLVRGAVAKTMQRIQSMEALVETAAEKVLNSPEATKAIEQEMQKVTEKAIKAIGSTSTE